MDGNSVDLRSVRAILAKRLPLYAHKPPTYQTTMLQELAAHWEGHERLLDVGGGTGVIGEAIQTLFGPRVTSVDVQDRYAPGLPTTTLTYDGLTLPFADSSFDAAMLNNVLHHVPLAGRVPLLTECRRVCSGPLYIKDHLATSALDHARLAALDLIGNLPFLGMISARYLTEDDWRELREATGYAERARSTAAYRSPLFATIFPNRLEVTMKWTARAAL
jgi:SAM-dependent methyltransferase